MIRREEKMEFNNSVLTYLICIVIIIWGFIGIAAGSEIRSGLSSFVTIISWISIGGGFFAGAYKKLKGSNK